MAITDTGLQRNNNFTSDSYGMPMLRVGRPQNNMGYIGSQPNMNINAQAPRPPQQGFGADHNPSQGFGAGHNPRVEAQNQGGGMFNMGNTSANSMVDTGPQPTNGQSFADYIKTNGFNGKGGDLPFGNTETTRGLQPNMGYTGASFAPSTGYTGASFAPNTGAMGASFSPQTQQGQQMALPTTYNTQNQGASIPTGLPQTSTFKPVTFRSGTGTSTSDAGGITTELNEPYSGLSGLVGSGSGLLGQAALQSQQTPNQFSYNFNPQQAGQELFNQRSALLEPAFAQQNTKAQEAMFGSGRLGLRLAGEGVGAGSGMVSPDAFGVSQAQSQALAGLAQQSTEDAFAQEMQKSALDSNQFAMNQAGQQQQYANLMGSGQGMLQAGMQGTQLEQAMAQQQLQNQQLNQDYNLAQQNYNLAAQGQGFNQGLSNQQLALAAQGQEQDYGLNEAQFNLASQGQFQDYGLSQQQQLQDYGLAQQNYGLAQQQQMQDYGFGMQNYGLAQQQQLQDYGFGMQDYGLNQQKMGLAQQQQQLDYGMAMLRGDQNYGLQRDVAAQNYEMGTEQNAIARLTGQAQANANNYQPDPWLSAGVGLGTSYLGTDAGSNWLSGIGGDIWNWAKNIDLG